MPKDEEIPEEVENLLIAMGMAGIQLQERGVAELVLKLVDLVRKKKGAFTPDEVRAISKAVKVKYDLLDKKFKKDAASQPAPMSKA